ncbi:Nif11-like leader peptide family natural product precursor [Nostoc sp. CALU 1950]|uniref:Nif11-like leader peptide family natural product precursor n=1 Tax=Nostoc sp. CALU 1950 TaxID=3104321 RepID=UPI003EB894E5
MSEQVTKFFEEVNHEESLQKQVKTAIELQDIINIAAQIGYNFNSKELLSGLQKLLNIKLHHDYMVTRSEGAIVRIPEGVEGLEYLTPAIKTICNQNPT